MRKRLTSKALYAENRKDGLFPGDVGNEERDKFYYDIDEFENEASEFKPGYDLPEKYDIKDERDEMNFGVRKSDVRAMFIARRALMMAHSFLGPKASEAQVEAQAWDFMKMGNSGIMSSLKRRQAALEEKLDEVAEEKKEEVPETVAGCKTVKAEDVVAPAEEKVEVTETTAEETAPAEEKTEEKVEETVETPAENVEEIEACKASDEEPELEIEVPAAPATTETELTVTEVAPDAELESAFGGEEVEACGTIEQPKAAVTAKQGISHMAQPKLTTAAVKPNEDELSMVWDELKTPTFL